MQTRRQFLRDCSLAVATTALVPAALAHNPTLQTLVPSGPGFAQFSRQLNTSFFLRTEVKQVQLFLVDATEFSPSQPAAPDAGNEKFSLLFRGPTTTALTQDTYSFEHGHLGQLSIFIVPAGERDSAHQYYKAIYDRPLNHADLTRQLASAPQRARNI